jgi:HEAT repeat protein
MGLMKKLARWFHRLGFGLLALVQAIPAPAQEPPAVTTTRASAADPQRLSDYVALIEGPNLPLAARRTGARELLRQGWTETAGRLATILNGQNADAKTAIALALADVPEFLEDTYVDPLLAMLGDADAESRRAAAAALAGYRNSGVVPRLRGVLLDESQPPVKRLAAIDALGMMTRREAVSVLVEALRDPSGVVSQPALRALEQMTATSFGDDAARAQAWWTQRQNLPEPEWQQDQINRLVQKDRELGRRLHELEGRLVEAYRQDYMKAKDPDRAALLQSYLADSSAFLVRLLGLELVQSQLGEGKTLATDAAGQIRAMLIDPEPDVRAAAVQAVARLREKPDANRFLELLASERQVKVRRALVNALGYVGTGAVVEPLLAIVRGGAGGRPHPPTASDSARSEADDPCLTEAIAALGRLAERKVLTEDARAAVADALLATYRSAAAQNAAQATSANDARHGERTPPTPNAPAAATVLRERVLWAMSLVADPRFDDIFIAALADTEPSTVRQAAVRGIATLKKPALADALVPLVREPDAALRRAVVETLAELIARDEHLEALWSRLDPAVEADDSIRKTAWRGCVRYLTGRAVAEVERRVARLPQGSPDHAQNAIELLQVMETSLATSPDKRAELGRVRLRLARQRLGLKLLDETLASYLAALADLRAAQAPEAPSVARELLRFALVNSRYTGPVVAAIADGNPPLDGAAVWEEVKVDIEQRLTSRQFSAAIAMLESLRGKPPTTFSPAVSQAIDEMLQRARALQAGGPSSTPSSRSADVPK